MVKEGGRSCPERWFRCRREQGNKVAMCLVAGDAGA